MRKMTFSEAVEGCISSRKDLASDPFAVARIAAHARIGIINPVAYPSQPGSNLPLTYGDVEQGITN